MKKFISIFCIVMLIGAMFVGCGSAEEVAETNGIIKPIIVEDIIVEDIIVEDIIVEDIIVEDIIVEEID